MKLLRYINPIFLLNKVFYMLKDIDNLLFYYRQVNKMKRTGTHTLNNIKIDKINRIYTAANMPPELLMASDREGIERQEKLLLGNHMQKLERVMQDYNLYELIKYRYERVKTDTYYGYKVWTTFKFKTFSFWWTVWITFYFWMLVKLILGIPWMEYLEKTGLLELLNK